MVGVEKRRETCAGDCLTATMEDEANGEDESNNGDGEEGGVVVVVVVGGDDEEEEEDCAWTIIGIGLERDSSWGDPRLLLLSI